MKTSACLSQQELTLCHYGELPANGPELQHLGSCPTCRTRLEALEADLARLPRIPVEIDQASATRLAARVSERLQHRRPRWLPALGGALTAAAALVIALLVWQPTMAPREAFAPNLQVANHSGAMPDIELLVDLDLLEDLELLRQIEGV